MDRTPSLGQLLRLVDDAQSLSDLGAYFGTDRPSGAPIRYAGGRFEQLSGGGDRPGAADRITADDLFAVQLLEVRVPIEVGLDLLEGKLGRSVSNCLRQIPPDVSIDDAEAAELLADGAVADHVWFMLERQHGMGWVTVNKLLARKRPQLIPVYDRVVRCAYGALPKFWNWLRSMFWEQDHVLTSHLEAQRAAAGVPIAVSPLRILDVIVWMRHEADHSSARCAGLAWSEWA